MKQHLKCVIWNKSEEPPLDGIYKYAVIGLLVTDRKIQELEVIPQIKDGEIPVEYQVVIDTPCHGLAELLQYLPKRNARRTVGDAVDVLLTLGEI